MGDGAATGGAAGAVDALAPSRHLRAAALARPAARRIAELLAVARGPLTAGEIAVAAGRHHSGVRGHLAALEAVGLVEGRTDPARGRGRPARRYRLVPDPDGREADGHRELVRLLMALVGRLALTSEEVERFGVEQGRAVPRPGGGVAELWTALERLGFAPRPGAGGPSREIILDRCPFIDGVEAPGGRLICALHRGLARGILGTAAAGVVLEDLIAMPPRGAGCRLRLAQPTITVAIEK
ncbi:helix-turn-helix domain-containing protein [Miltoncostaea marina]|uniref:helix-turn-helix domain-containing protein n=1 Tax=Miltoncostaea marina TaxID=2843215 RepID=UPI001C3CA2B0|nr:helix-turn-helix domain-containing protein [Miltoncostaea marina]